MLIRRGIAGLILSLSASTALAAQTPDIEFFEAKIRPVLAQKCYGCHNSKMPAPKGSLVLDTREGLLKGGVSGPAVVPGKPAESHLIKALSYSDPLAQMPPSGKLPDAVLADFEQWIARARPTLARALPRSPRQHLNTRACRSRRDASGGHSNRSYTPVGRAKAAEPRRRTSPIDYFIKAKLASEEIANVSAGRSPHAGDARLCRSRSATSRPSKRFRRSSTIGRRMPTSG